MKKSNTPPADIFPALAPGRTSAVYLFTGTEEFLMDEALADLKRLLIAPGFEDFDVDRFYGGEADFADILKKLVTPPFASKQRLVVIKNLKKMLPSEHPALVGYARSPSPTTCLVVVAPRDQAPVGLVAQLKHNASVVNFSSIPDHQMPATIESRARSKGLELEPGAAELMSELTGDSLLTVDSELDKLKIFLGGESKVTRTMIVQMSTDSRAYQVWHLTQTIVGRNRKKALAILRHLDTQHVDPTWIVSSLAVRFLSLFENTSGTKGSGRPSGWNRAAVVECLRQLKAIDGDIKQSRKDPFYLLESFIVNNLS